MGDAGLQAERTALAWTRTAASLVLLPVPLVVIAARRQEWPLLIVCALALIASAGTAVHLATHVRHTVHHDRVWVPPFRSRLLPVLGLMLVIAGCAVAAAIS